MSTTSPTLESINFHARNVHAQQRGPLGERLIRAGLIASKELEQALQLQQKSGTRLGETLAELGFIEEQQLLPFLAEQMGVPSVQLREGIIDPEAVRLIPRRIAEDFSCLALFKVRDELTVAMVDPQELAHIDQLEAITELTVRPVLVMRSSLDSLLTRAYEAGFEVDTVTADMDHEAISVQDGTLHVELQQLDSLADGSPIVNLVNYAILHAVRQGASDIHIEPGSSHSSIRFRVDGQLREVLRPRREFHASIVSRVKVISKLDIAEHRMPQDGRVQVIVDKREIDLRVSTLPTVRGEKIVLRVLDRGNVTFNLDQLGMPSMVLNSVRSMLAKPHGLILVTGPTGSGKTTTLYSAIQLIKSVASNIVTVEDPVEYQLSQINQVQASSVSGLSFAKALRSILRQDPDVIMVGEIRDQETAEVAVQAALTGHLVLSTLHTNDAASAVTRLADMGVAPYKIATALTGVIAQRLLRTICKKCRTTYYPDVELLKILNYTGNPDHQFVRGEGCHACYDTGFRGRTGIYEVLNSEPQVRKLISQGADIMQIKQWNREQGGTTLLEEGLKLAEQGLTSLDEVMRVAHFD